MYKNKMFTYLLIEFHASKKNRFLFKKKVNKYLRNTESKWGEIETKHMINLPKNICYQNMTVN